MASFLILALIVLALAGWAFWALRRIRRRKGCGCGGCTPGFPYRGNCK